MQLPSALRDIQGVDNKLSELSFLRPSRSLLRKMVDSNGASRRMQEQGEGCQISLLQVLPPPAFKQFAECQRTRTQNVDNGIVGSALDIGARCWCDNKVKESIDALGCCQHPDFKNLCELQCEPDCASAEAQQCLEKCPPICS